MTQSTQCFTQSLRLLDPVNQKRIKLTQRILWPDYETLAILNNFSENAQNSCIDMDLNNLFLYCPFQENFLIKQTKTNQYLNLKQLYSDQFTHLAFWVCKSQSYNSKLFPEFVQTNRVIENRRQQSLQKGFRERERVPKYQDMYVILCKRPLAIDQIVKTSHKVCISVAPLSKQKFLWGGALHYEEFESLQQEKKEQGGLFRTGGESFGFKIDSKPSFVPGSFRKSNGLIDKRQQRYSNYLKSQKQQSKQSQPKNDEQKQRKQCSNQLKILPQHIRQHRQFLYIQIDLDNNSQLPQRSNEYKFVSVDIYARHLKPKYGGVYQRQSSSSDSQDQYNELKGALNKYKRLLKQEIFLVYSMPFMEFNSYIESQLNFEENQQLREINFRGSCLMFSAMKKLELKSNNSNWEDKKEKQQDIQLKTAKKQKFMEIGQEKTSQRSMQSNLQVRESLQKLVEKENNIQWQQNKEIIQIIPHSSLSFTEQQMPNKELFKIERKKILTELCKDFNKSEQKLHSQQQKQEIFIPVFNSKGFEPLRIGVQRQFMEYLNPSINKLVTKVFVEGHRIKKEQQDQNERQWTSANNRKRLSVYIGKKKGQSAKEEEKDLIGLDVFLTDKVYKQQTVYLLIDFIRAIQNEAKSISSLSEDQCCLFTELRSIQQLRNVLILLTDINGETKNQSTCDNIKLLLWVQMLQRLNECNQSKLELIRQIQKQTQKLLTQTDLLKQDPQDENQALKNEKMLKAQQKLIINKIKNYHHKYTIYVLQSNFYVNLFFFFLTSQSNWAPIMSHFLSNNDSQQQKQKPQNKHSIPFLKATQNTYKSKLIQTVLNEFLLTNCKTILGYHSLQLSNIIDKISSSHHPQSKQPKLLLCSMLKSTVSYVIQNLSSIPVNIFLSEPFEQFDDQFQQCELTNQPQSQDIEFATAQQTAHIFSYQKLTRFLKKYFIKGHNFLQREASQNLIDADNSYMSLVTDLLNAFIKIMNSERSLTNDDELIKQRQLSNVIQLIRDQYSRCLLTNRWIKFDKVIRSEFSFLKTEQMKTFQMNQFDDSKMIQELSRKYVQIVENQSQWNVNILSYLINYPSKLPQNNITIINHTTPIVLSHHAYSPSKHYQFILTISQKILQKTASLQSSISLFPKVNHNMINGSSYFIDLVKTHMGLSNYHEKQHCIYDNKSLFTCFEVFVEVEITTNKSIINHDLDKIVLKGCNLLMFENFNNTQINKNKIFLHHFNQSKQKISCPLSNIRQVNVKIYSKKLPILQASLLFINFRLGKYLKNLLKQSSMLQSIKPVTKTSKRKTIGGRFTEYLNNRKSVHVIEQNIFFGQSQRKPKTTNQISTLFDLPQPLLFDVLRADKSYIQDEEKILSFIDEFYERNQPQFSDYILYLCVRSNFLRSSTILKHYFANKLKYDESKILNVMITKRLSNFVSNSESQNISQLIIEKPRISSAKPLTNIQDTVQQRELLNKYMKDLTKKKSLRKNQHSHSISKSTLFSKKSIFQIKQEQCKESSKDIEI